MSALIGKHLILKAFPKLIAEMNHRIENNQDNLIYYMLFLRISPLVPNWFINISAPIVGIPYFYFLFATLFGSFHFNFRSYARQRPSRQNWSSAQRDKLNRF